MAFKRSAVRSRLSPPSKASKSSDFGAFSFAYLPQKFGVIFRFMSFYELFLALKVEKTTYFP